ncbi:hypothetical protein E2C01_066372 [Portunus trituberculatus]|uniref:Uncharacterized protein n=1 Tax=Portunus trituberculatus TaxID=210409 RepID=A0A5B7HQR6_PORTR|nr:hypothetical protein [Portunus trituberculatus]
MQNSPKNIEKHPQTPQNTSKHHKNTPKHSKTPSNTPKCHVNTLKTPPQDLNTHTLENNQVWLIGTVIRHGCMAVKEMDPRKSMAGQGKKTMLTTSDFLRRFVVVVVVVVGRPYGIIIMDLTEQIRKRKEAVLSGTPQMDDDNKNQLFASMFL